MALSRLGIYTRNNLRLCTTYNSGITHIRYSLHLKNTTAAEINEYGKIIEDENGKVIKDEKGKIKKYKSNKIIKDQVYMDKLNEVQDYNYFEQGVDATPKTVDNEIRRKETVFISEALKPKGKPYEGEETDYGKVWKDPARNFKQIKTDGAMPTYMPFKRNKNLLKYDELSDYNLKRKEKSCKSNTVNLSEQPSFEISNNALSKNNPEKKECNDSANIFDQQYFGVPNNAASENKSQTKERDREHNFIEEQYFPSNHDQSTGNSFGDTSFDKFVDNTIVQQGKPIELSDEKNLNYFDQSLFMNNTTQGKTVVKQEKQVLNQSQKSKKPVKNETKRVEKNFDDRNQSIGNSFGDKSFDKFVDNTIVQQGKPIELADEENLNYFDQSLFMNNNEHNMNTTQVKTVVKQEKQVSNQSQKSKKPVKNETKRVEQNFGDRNQSIGKNFGEKSFNDTTIQHGQHVKIAGEENLNYSDQTLFKNNKAQVKVAKEKQVQNKKSKDSVKNEKLIVEENFDDHGVYNFDLNASMAQNLKFISEEEQPSADNDDNTTRIENLTRREMNDLRSRKVNIEKPKNAYEAVLRMRVEDKKKKQNISEEYPVNFSSGKWDGKVDSKGFRILTSQTQDLQQLIDNDLVSLLCDSVLFENEELVAINKPYGLPSHHGPGVSKSVASLLEKMATKKEKKETTYYVVHRLDKETTGVMLLAKTAKSAKKLTDMFLRREVVKVYWAITKGVPQQEQGIIDIPIGEGKVTDMHRMCLVPNYSKDMKLLRNSTIRKDSRKAVTHYKVLSSNNHAALVECRPETGLKHQIRVHLSMGLNTPILGDHKYSHLDKIVPQRLPPQILEMLKIRQQKVRHLSMHLHARSLVLPEFSADGRNLFISAKLPPHFEQNMRWLKLSRNN